MRNKFIAYEEYHYIVLSSGIEWDPKQNRLALCTGSNKIYMWSVSGCLSVEVPCEGEFAFFLPNDPCFTSPPNYMLLALPNISCPPFIFSALPSLCIRGQFKFIYTILPRPF